MKSSTVVSAAVTKRHGKMSLWPIGKRDLGFIIHQRRGELRRKGFIKDRERARTLEILYTWVVNHPTEIVGRSDYVRMIDRLSERYGAPLHDDMAFSVDNIT